MCSLSEAREEELSDCLIWDSSLEDLRDSSEDSIFLFVSVSLHGQKQDPANWNASEHLVSSAAELDLCKLPLH